MGRELKRREKRKNKNKNQELNVDTSMSAIGVAKVVGAVIILLLVLYYVLAVFVTKEIDISSGSSSNNDTNSSDSVSDRILASNIFKQAEEEYYVYFYDFNDADASINNVISGISDKVYRVDTSSSLNANYVSEDDSNKNARELDDLKVKSNTLIKIKADEIEEYYEGAREIIDGIDN